MSHVKENSNNSSNRLSGMSMGQTSTPDKSKGSIKMRGTTMIIEDDVEGDDDNSEHIALN